MTPHWLQRRRMAAAQRAAEREAARRRSRELAQWADGLRNELDTHHIWAIGTLRENHFRERLARTYRRRGA